MTDSVPVAILGATGYAGELSARLLLQHPGFEVVHLGSDRLAGTPFSEAVPAFGNVTDLVMQPDTPEAIRASGAKAIVLCKKAPEVTEVVPALLDAGIRIVDIGAEFRLRELATYEQWYGGPHACPELLSEAIYGLSEIHTDAIRQARIVGNPGCYATAMQLPIIPLLQAGLIDLSAPLMTVGYSGISGAGKRFMEGNNNLFWATNENLHAYKALNHQHQAEVDQELTTAAGQPVHLHFVPHLAPITRGILCTISFKLSSGAGKEQIDEVWRKAYVGRPFARVRSDSKQVEVAHVAGTNHCDFACAVDGDVCVINSATDNLIKGAAGQAVQNLNLMHGFDETLGLLGITAI